MATFSRLVIQILLVATRIKSSNLPLHFKFICGLLPSFLCYLTQKNKRTKCFFRFVACILLVWDTTKQLAHEHLGTKYSNALPEVLKLTNVNWLNLYLPIASILGIILLIELIKTLKRPLILLLPALLFLTGSVVHRIHIFLAKFTQHILRITPRNPRRDTRNTSIIWLNHSLLTVLKDSGNELKFIFKD